MSNEMMTLISNVYDKILKDKQIDADKYEREDAYFGIIEDIENGNDCIAAFINAFSLVHATELTREYVKVRLNMYGYKKINNKGEN